MSAAGISHRHHPGLGYGGAAGANRRGSSQQLPTTVLLSNVPPFLHSTRAIRDWIAPIGSARNVKLIPPPKKDSSYDDDDDDEEEQKIDKKIRKETSSSPEDEPPETPTITGLVALSHPDAALRLISAFKHFKVLLDQHQQNRKEDEGTKKENNGGGDDERASSSFKSFQAYVVPVNPDVPLPPPMLDKASTEVLGKKLLASFAEWRDGVKDFTKLASSGGGGGTSSRSSQLSSSADATTAVSSAATGSEDEEDEDEVDPLTTTQVLEAVTKFRKKLERMQGSKASRRKELVASKIEQMLPIVRQRMRQEREAAASGLPPVYLPPPPPPPPGYGLAAPPPPPPPGARGVSNLPAWMTKQQQQGGGDDMGEPSAKRTKLDPAELGVFPIVPASSHDALRQYIKDLIRQHLGEGEATLTDFVYKHVLTEKASASLLPELNEVLDEDAPKFILQLWEKVQELARQ